MSHFVTQVRNVVQEVRVPTLMLPGLNVSGSNNARSCHHPPSDTETNTTTTTNPVVKFQEITDGKFYKCY